MHNVLIHGCSVIDFFKLFIGIISEEAFVRHISHCVKNDYFIKKISQKHLNIDLINSQLFASDSFILEIKV